MTKKQRTLEVIERLRKEYPDADCTLDYDQAWKLLVSVRLAAQCTDARVNVVVEGLFAKYPTVEALAEADVNNIEEIVRPCGLGKSKARDISACMKMLRDEYGGKIPKDFNAILKLPGVGRKSANLIMGDVFGEPAIVTDTHCIRLVNRIGLVDGIKDPKKVEMELWKLVPPEEGSDFCHRLKLLNLICQIYITVIRGTPVVVQLLIIYFVIFATVDIEKWIIAAIAFGINSGAYVAEIFRSGIMAVDNGQFEAGRSLGFNYRQTMIYIIMPQAFKNVLPALGNEFIVLLKETSVAGYIALQDLTKGGDIIRSRTYDALMPLMAVAIIYLVMVMIFSKLVSMLERRLRNSDH